ncbi:MAG: hypothetical protein LLG15_04225 [Betaproteobacteria bacterium]|nr:hypothetical protein [Betaproteobacteria bacterium]
MSDLIREPILSPGEAGGFFLFSVLIGVEAHDERNMTRKARSKALLAFILSERRL